MIKKLVFILMVSFMTASCDFLGSGQPPLETAGKDVITVSRDRTIDFNGKSFEIKGKPIDKEGLSKVFGVPSRLLDDGYIWDNKGISIVVKNKNVINIAINFESNEKGFKEFYTVPKYAYKGIIKIEDGYFSNETTIGEFRKSKIGREEFKERTGYLGERYSPKTVFIKEKPEVTVKIDADGEGGRITGVSIY